MFPARVLAGWRMTVPLNIIRKAGGRSITQLECKGPVGYQHVLCSAGSWK